jgi:hypothetical protein
MTEQPPPLLSGNLKRRNWGRLIRDILLLPPALLYVIIERVFWVGAKRLLRDAARIQSVQRLQTKLQKLPAPAILPMFLLPEIFSHIGGFWASDLLVRRQWVAAMLVGIFIKGTATLMEVWIYQSCEEKLLSVQARTGLGGRAHETGPGRRARFAARQPIRPRPSVRRAPAGARGAPWSRP